MPILADIKAILRKNNTDRRNARNRLIVTTWYDQEEKRWTACLTIRYRLQDVVGVETGRIVRRSYRSYTYGEHPLQSAAVLTPGLFDALDIIATCRGSLHYVHYHFTSSPDPVHFNGLRSKVYTF